MAGGRPGGGALAAGVSGTKESVLSGTGGRPGGGALAAGAAAAALYLACHRADFASYGIGTASTCALNSAERDGSLGEL